MLKRRSMYNKLNSGINIHCLDYSGTYIVVILLETSVSNSITTIYVPEQSKQCTFIPILTHCTKIVIK